MRLGSPGSTGATPVSMAPPQIGQGAPGATLMSPPQRVHRDVTTSGMMALLVGRQAGLRTLCANVPETAS